MASYTEVKETLTIEETLCLKEDWNPIFAGNIHSFPGPLFKSLYGIMFEVTFQTYWKYSWFRRTFAYCRCRRGSFLNKLHLLLLYYYKCSLWDRYHITWYSYIYLYLYHLLQFSKHSTKGTSLLQINCNSWYR